MKLLIICLYKSNDDLSMTHSHFAIWPGMSQPGESSQMYVTTLARCINFYQSLGLAQYTLIIGYFSQ